MGGGDEGIVKSPYANGCGTDKIGRSDNVCPCLVSRHREAEIPLVLMMIIKHFLAKTFSSFFYGVLPLSSHSRSVCHQVVGTSWDRDNRRPIVITIYIKDTSIHRFARIVSRQKGIFLYSSNSVPTGQISYRYSKNFLDTFAFSSDLQNSWRETYFLEAVRFQIINKNIINSHSCKRL